MTTYDPKIDPFSDPLSHVMIKAHSHLMFNLAPSDAYRGNKMGYENIHNFKIIIKSVIDRLINARPF